MANAKMQKHRSKNSIKFSLLYTKKSKLIIFENQPSDFLSIRKALESLLDGNVVEHHKKTWKYISFMNTILIAINILAAPDAPAATTFI